MNHNHAAPTPGPWRVETRPDVMRVGVFGAPHPDGTDYAPIVVFGDRSHLPDAYLIAAAPTMYEALDLDAVADKLERDDPEQSQSAIASFRAQAKQKRAEALAKAEGRAA